MYHKWRTVERKCGGEGREGSQSRRQPKFRRVFGFGALILSTLTKSGAGSDQLDQLATESPAPPAVPRLPAPSSCCSRSCNCCFMTIARCEAHEAAFKSCQVNNPQTTHTHTHSPSRSLPVPVSVPVRVAIAVAVQVVPVQKRLSFRVPDAVVFLFCRLMSLSRSFAFNLHKQIK